MAKPTAYMKSDSPIQGHTEFFKHEDWCDDSDLSHCQRLYHQRDYDALLAQCERYADQLLKVSEENGKLKTRAASLEGALQDSREMYGQMEDTLDAARAVLSADPVTHECLLAQCNQLLRGYDGAVGRPLATEVVGWQFHQEDKWTFGPEHHNHRANTEQAGIPTRNVYAGCKVANVRPVLSAAAFKKELLKATKAILHPHIEGVYAVFELQQESQHD